MFVVLCSAQLEDSAFECDWVFHWCVTCCGKKWVQTNLFHSTSDGVDWMQALTVSMDQCVKSSKISANWISLLAEWLIEPN